MYWTCDLPLGRSACCLLVGLLSKLNTAIHRTKQGRNLVVAALLLWEVNICSLSAKGTALELDYSSGRAVSLQPVMEMVLLDD